MKHGRSCQKRESRPVLPKSEYLRSRVPGGFAPDLPGLGGFVRRFQVRKATPRPNGLILSRQRKSSVLMSSGKAARRTLPRSARLSVWARATKMVARQWMVGDGLVWLHLLKTVTAALLAMGIAMLLELSSPRTAMVTVFVLMQPMSGMVLAKSFYRVLGTAAGTIASLLLGGVFVQQPELYILGMTIWIGACTAAAVRYRHFRWYGFVLAGYT